MNTYTVRVEDGVMIAELRATIPEGWRRVAKGVVCKDDQKLMVDRSGAVYWREPNEYEVGADTTKGAKATIRKAGAKR